jgi:phytoene dehydrogenase-like protein
MLFKRSDRPKDHYEVVVIGSGLAGMTAANRLARNGRKVLLLESHNKLGGFATWFRRQQGDHIFDISLHGFPVGMIKTCRKYWSREIADSIRQVKNVRYINPQFAVETDFTRTHFTNVLIEKFGVSQDCVEAFFHELETMNFYDPPQMTNGELFEKYFPDRNDVQRFLLEPIVYANGSTLEDPAISYGIVFSNFMSKGVYIFQGGTDRLIGMMKDELVKNGVDIKLHSKIDQLQIETNGDQPCVKGVVLNDQIIKADAVLSNANLISTINKMAGRQYFSEQFLTQVDKVRLNTSSCQVFMGFKEGVILPEIGELIFTSEDAEFNTDLVLSPHVGSQTFSVYTPDMRPDGSGRYAIVSSSNARYEDWKKLTEEDYKAQKEFVIERALNGLEKIVPGVSDMIELIDCSTPLTVEKYTHHKQGSSFGTKFEGLPISMNLHEQIHGLFHAGSVGIIMSGWLGAANYGVIQAHALENYLSKVEDHQQTGATHESI